MPDPLTVLARGPSPSDIARVTRHLLRLEAIAARYRSRRRIIRLVRGGVAAVAAFILLLKTGFEGSLTETLVVAALVGLFFAWPFIFYAILTLIAALASVFGNEWYRMENLDWCFGPNARRARLDALIAQRRAWLAAPTGEVPRIRDGRRPARR